MTVVFWLLATMLALYTHLSLLGAEMLCFLSMSSFKKVYKFFLFILFFNSWDMFDKSKSKVLFVWFGFSVCF